MMPCRLTTAKGLIAAPESFTPIQPWAYATYNRTKRQGDDLENSYDGFVAGKSIDAQDDRKCVHG